MIWIISLTTITAFFVVRYFINRKLVTKTNNIERLEYLIHLSKIISDDPDPGFNMKENLITGDQLRFRKMSSDKKYGHTDLFLKVDIENLSTHSIEEWEHLGDYVVEILIKKIKKTYKDHPYIMNINREENIDKIIDENNS